MELIWYLLVILAMGALCSLAMILISDHLQHREMYVSSVRKQDIFQYQLDRITAQQNSVSEKQPSARSTLDGRPAHREGSSAKAEAVAQGSKTRAL